VPAGTRRGDAEKLVTELVKRRNEGQTVVTDKATLGDYLVDRWLPIQRTRLRASTYDSYRRNIELHVIPALGRRPLDKLTVDDLDLLYARLLMNGHKGEKGGGLSPKTVRYIHLIIHKALADAHRKGAVVRNVAALADAPKVGARKRGDLKAWDADQLRAFLEAIGSHRLCPAFHLAAHTGMRRGEVLGLRWVRHRLRGWSALGSPGPGLRGLRHQRLRRENRLRPPNDRSRSGHRCSAG